MEHRKVLYVAERCVCELGEKGLKLTEVYPGVNLKRDVLDLLPFKVDVDLYNH